MTLVLVVIWKVGEVHGSRLSRTWAPNLGVYEFEAVLSGYRGRNMLVSTPFSRVITNIMLKVMLGVIVDLLAWWLNSAMCRLEADIAKAKARGGTNNKSGSLLFVVWPRNFAA